MLTEENQIKQAFERAKEEQELQEPELNENMQNNSEELGEEPKDVMGNAEEDMPQNDEEVSNEDLNDGTFDIKDILAENEQLRSALVKEQNDRKEDHEKLVRALAESENQKKRIEADVERERKFGNEKILKALIPVVDSMELALKHADPNDEKTKPMVEGVQNTVTLLLKELGNFGVVEVNPEGQVFDPNLHQAISMAPSNEIESNHVISVMQKGFTLNGRVVRPAMVIVSNGKPHQPDNGAENVEVKNTINVEA
jgi:molecular chaperone GrpE